ncbi:MAG: LysR family transcriptional regulator [Pseudomonadota bacterium]|nr:MAG: LysR family transcriptional regulator [Pseudomonadota bacterium]
MVSFRIVNLSSIDLNLLVVLRAVLDERSVARAAARLHVTPPAVSNALARLRDLFGDPLFVRSGRGITPTPRALELAPILDRSLGLLETSLQGGAFDPESCTRELTIALSDADLVASLSAIAKVFTRRLPKATLRVVTLDTLVSLGGLAGESVDLAIGPPVDEPGLHSQLLFEEAGVLIARRSHPRVRRVLTKEAFNREGHVDILLLLGRAGAGNRAVEQAMREAGLVRRIVATVPTFAAAASIVASTDFLSGVPLRAARLFARALPIRILEGPLRPFWFPMHLCWHERTHHDPAVAAFRAVVVEALAERKTERTAAAGGRRSRVARA